MTKRKKSQVAGKRKADFSAGPLLVHTKKTKHAESPPLEPRHLFRILELPAELRNHIYECIAEDETLYLYPRGRGRAICQSVMPRLNRQVREEYNSVLALFAGNIVARVYDFDFRHIVTFWNRFSDIELQSLPTKKLASPRKVEIQLSVLREVGYNSELLWRWLKRAVHPTKKGTNMDVSYRVVHSLSSFPGFSTPAGYNSGRADHVNNRAVVLEQQVQSWYDEKMPETRKIAKALRDYAYEHRHA